MSIADILIWEATNAFLLMLTRWIRDDLLKVAKQYCPGAVYAIEEALRLAGSSRRYHFVLCSKHHAFVHPY